MVNFFIPFKKQIRDFLKSNALLFSKTQKICFLLFLFFILFWDYAHFLTTPIVLEKRDSQQSIILKSGENGLDLVKKISAENFSNQPFYQLAYIYLTGKYKHLRAGEYELKNYSNFQSFIDDVVFGRVKLNYFTFIEGEDFSAALNKAQNTSLIIDETTKKWLDEKIKLNNLIESNLKINHNSLFIADSFAYTQGDNLLVVLKASHHKLNETLKVLRAEFNNDWSTTKTNEQMLVIASLLEKESADYEDKRKIAGVIKNRLENNMKLEIDASVIFAHSHEGNQLSELSFNDLKINSQYNTYKNKNLPPYPIAMVSADSLKAAFNPQMHDFLFYVAEKNGLHYFSKTYKEHLQFIQYQKTIPQ